MFMMDLNLKTVSNLPVRYVTYKDMPYEGCGHMYEYPHYCPVHLFAATSAPIPPPAKPLRIALLEALKLKAYKFELELYQKNQIENVNVINTEEPSLAAETKSNQEKKIQPAELKVVKKEKGNKIDIETASVSYLLEDLEEETLEPLKKMLDTNTKFESINGNSGLKTQNLSNVSPKQCLRKPNTPQLRTGIES